MTLDVRLSRCVCVRHISLGGEGNVLYPAPSSYLFGFCFLPSSPFRLHAADEASSNIKKLTKAVCTRAMQLQYNCNTRIFSCVAVVLHLCGPQQYNAAIQVFYNLQKTCRFLVAIVKKLAIVLRLCGLLQYNKIFVLCYCSCIALVQTA